MDLILALYRLLNNKNYYSLSLPYVSQILQVPESTIRWIAASDEFSRSTGDRLNIFTYNNVTYIGLETRRIDYERDRLNGTNWVEDAIKAGLYN